MDVSIVAYIGSLTIRKWRPYYYGSGEGFGVFEEEEF